MAAVSHLHSFAYVSQARMPLTEAALTELLVQSRENNRRTGITGLLICCGSSFFQVVEGTESALDSLYSKLLDDNRHYDVRRLMYRPIDTRIFDSWAMAFRRYESVTSVDVEGFSSLLEKGLDLSESVKQRKELVAMIEIFRSLFDTEN